MKTVAMILYSLTPRRKPNEENASDIAMVGSYRAFSVFAYGIWLHADDQYVRMDL